jgi:hypothetical protein
VTSNEVECDKMSRSLAVKRASHKGTLTTWWGNWVSILQAKCDKMKTCDLSLGILFYLRIKCAVIQNVNYCINFEEMSWSLFVGRFGLVDLVKECPVVIE